MAAVPVKRGRLFYFPAVEVEAALADESSDPDNMDKSRGTMVLSPPSTVRLLKPTVFCTLQLLPLNLTADSDLCWQLPGVHTQHFMKDSIKPNKCDMKKPKHNPAVTFAVKACNVGCFTAKNNSQVQVMQNRYGTDTARKRRSVSINSGDL